MRRRRRGAAPSHRVRRLAVLIVVGIVSLTGAVVEYHASQRSKQATLPPSLAQNKERAIDALRMLEVKGRAPKTGYKRVQFGNGWLRGADGCDTRNVILRRDLAQPEVDARCKVLSGVLNDPYTGKQVYFLQGPSTSDKVQIDHVVALSNAWQTGAQQLSVQQRINFANDPLNLLAVDGAANQQKGDGDAATWLPSRREYRCAYVARQIYIKQRYQLWVTPAEKTAMERILQQCPAQPLPQE